jgi:hypothetical protein
VSVVRIEGLEFRIEGDRPNEREKSMIRRALMQRDAAAATEQMQAQNNAELGALGRFNVGIGRGFDDVGEGISQLARSAVGDATEYTQEVQADRNVYDRATQDASGFGSGRFVGSVLPTLAVPGGAGATLAARAGGAAAAGAGIGAASFVEEGGSRLANTALGAAGGGGASGLLSGVGRTARWATGRDISGRSSQLADEFDVPITVGEARGSGALQGLETLLDRLPLVGTRGFREGQQGAAARAAQRVEAEVGREVDDVGESLVGHIRRTLSGRRARATRMFNRVERMAGDEAVALQGTRTAVQQAVGGVERQQTRQAIARAVGDQAEFRDMSFGQARRMRSEMGAIARSLDTAASGPNPTATAALEARAVRQVVDALESDIQAFANRRGGALAERFNRARDYYAASVVPLKRDFGRYITRNNPKDPDSIFATFIRPATRGNPRTVQAERLIDAVGPQGKDVVRFAVLREAWDAAQVATNGTQMFSPAKFAQALERLQKANRVVFTREQAAQIEGLTHLMRVAHRAGKFLENPPTGQRLLDAGVAVAGLGGAAVAPGSAAVVGGGIKTLSVLLTSQTGRRLLTQASDAQPGTARAGRLMEAATAEVRRIIERASARAGVELSEDE